MPFSPDQHVAEGQHAWAVIRRRCDVADPDDPFIEEVVRLFRAAYGEDEVVSLAADPGVEATFDLSSIRRAFRMGLPDPDREGEKPGPLANYRSEPAEVVARGALAQVHGLEFPASPQQGKLNPNQPILGFDGWGVDRQAGEYRLVLVQVKGTDDQNCPPREARKLEKECRRVPIELSKLSRALAILVVSLEATDHEEPLLRMLETLGAGGVPPLGVAPVVVRGTVEAQLKDLEPVRSAAPALAPLKLFGISISVGADLLEFGRVVTKRARAA